MKEIYEELAELLEVTDLTGDEILTEFECWDSLTILSIIAWASESHGKALLAKDINTAETVDKLVALLGSDI